MTAAATIQVLDLLEGWTDLREQLDQVIQAFGRAGRDLSIIQPSPA